MPIDLSKLSGSALNSLIPDDPRTKRGAISAGLSSGVDDIQGLAYSAGGALADAVGARNVRDWMNEQADRNQLESQRNGRPDLERIEDVWDSPSKWLPYAGYQVAKQIPNIASTIAASAIIPEAAIPAALSRGLANVPRALGGGGGLAAAVERGGLDGAAKAMAAGRGLASDIMGGAAMNYAQGVGSLYQEAVDGGNPNAGASALLGGVPYAISETAPEAMLLGRIKRGSGFTGNLGERMLKAGGTQALTGATSELLQNEMEMGYNGNVSPDEAWSRRLNSGVAGGLVEGLMGLGGGIRGGRKPTLDDNTEQGKPTNLLGIGYSGPLAGTPVVFPDGSVALNTEQELAKRYNLDTTDLDTLNGAISGWGGSRSGVSAMGADTNPGVFTNMVYGQSGLGGNPVDLLGKIAGSWTNQVEGHGLQVFDSMIYGQGGLSDQNDVLGRIAGDNPSLGAPGGRETFANMIYGHGGLATPNDLLGSIAGSNPSLGAPGGQRAFDGMLYGQGGLVDPNTLFDLQTQPAPLQQRIDQNMGIGQPGAPKNYPQQFRAAASEPTNLFAQDPATGREIRLDEGQRWQILAGDNVQLTPEVIRAQEVGVAAAQEKKAIEGRKERAAAAGLDPKKVPHVQAWSYIEEALDNGVIDQAEAARLAANVATGVDKVGGIQKYLTGLAATKQALKDGDSQAKQASIDKVQKKASNGTPTTQAQQAAPQGSQAPAAAAPATAVSTQTPVVSGEAPVVAGTLAERTKAKWDEMATATPGMPAYETLTKGQIARAEDLVNREVFNLAGASNVVGSGDNLPANKPSGGAVAGIAEGKTVTVGRKGREKSVTASELVDKMAKASPLEKARIAAAVGFEATVDPTTGAPKLVQIGEPQTLEAIAAAESKATGKKVTAEGVRVSLLKFGITPSVIDRVQAVAVDTVSAEELAINPEENGSGYRVETQASKATGQGLVDDGVGETKKQREARAQADEILKAAGPSTELAMADDRPTNLPEGAVVTDLRENNQSITEANVQAILNSKWAEQAALYWDHDAVSYDQLPATLKAEWVEDFRDNSRNNDGELNEDDLAASENRIARDYERFFAPISVPKVESSAQAGTDATGDTRGDRSVRDAEGDTATDVEAKPVTPFVPRGVASNDGQKAQAETGPDTGGDGKGSPVSGQRAGERTRESRKAQNGSQAVSTPVRAYSVEGLLEELKRFIRSDSLGRNVRVIASFEDLPADVDRALLDDRTQAVFRQQGGRTTVYLIADRIQKGTGRSVFLHEVGVHAGLERLLPRVAYEKLYQFLTNKAKAYSAGTDKSLEAKLAYDAAQRMSLAGVNVADLETLRSELVAYFVEEAVNAGVDPTASSKLSAPLRSWFRNLWAAFKTALRKLGFNADKLTARDIVDLAYGAARLEVAGTWHGTAANFRKFNHAFMGSGEGAQAYGWGTYLAQDPEIAEWYFTTDVKRKAKGGGIVGQDGIRISPKREAGETFAALDFSTTKGDIEAARKKFATRNLRPEARALGEAFLTRLEAEGAIYVPPSAPDGVLMRVDTSFNESELLDWDTTLDKQSPKVREVVENLLDEYGYGELKSSKGKLIYETLADEFGYESMGKNGAQALSEELDRRGVPGIKFLDVNSRNASKKLVYKGTTYDGDQLRALARQARDSGDNQKSMELLTLNDVLRSGLDKVKATLQDRVRSYEDMLYKITTDSAAKFGVSLAPDEARARAKEDANDLTEGKTLAWLEANAADITIVEADQTRNIVVFNDKDIQRVASRVANQRDRTLFSIAKKAEDQARKVAGETGAKIAVDTTNLASKALGALTYLHDIVESAKAKLPSAEKWYKATMDIQAARNRMNQEAERIVKMFTETGIRADKVNKMLFDATFEQKWPYDTERLDRKTGQMVTIKADPELANRFDNELTAKERAIVKAVFAHGEKTLDHKYAVIKKLGLEGTFKAETGKLQGPYAPLKRFGNYISVLKSADLVAAEDAGDEKLTEKLKADPEHYEVRFHDTKGQASEYARANAKAGGQAYHFEKSERVGGALPMNSRVLSNIRAALKVDDKMPPQARAHFEQMLQELEFQALDEHHARTSGLTRKNRAGAEEDMMRSFLANARAQSNFLAQLEYGKEANTQFYAMQREASKDGYAGQDEFNLLAKHYAASFDTRETPIQNRITAMTTAFQLATSLGYHITNALQGVMVTVPKLAADFNDYTGAMDQLHNGYKTWLAAGGLKGKFDLDSVKDAGLRATLQHAADMGVLDVGMTEDLSQFEAFRTGYKGIDAASGKMSKLMHKLNQVSRYVETANRVSAATAAYKMAMAKHGDQAKAQEYAARILQTTQGDFSATGSPLIFKKLPKFVMQYKKYQFMMASLYANAFNAALRGATPEERAVGRRFLAYKLATTGVAAGFLGLPMMNVAALVFGMTGDDDEPKDLERSLRDWIGDDGLADLILRGPLNAIGLDMSAKLGDDKIFSIAPYTDIDFSSGASAAKTLVGIGGGPAANQIMRMATGVEYLSKGDMQKGFENLVPSGLANASKALRIANEGFTLKNGTVMYSPDEISGLTLMFDAIGLKSSQMKHMEWVRGQQYEIGKFVSDRTKELKADYVQAYRDGNTDELGKLSEHWLKLQEVKRDLRPMFNNSVDELKTQPLSDLLRSPANALKRDLKAQKASW